MKDKALSVAALLDPAAKTPPDSLVTAKPVEDDETLSDLCGLSSRYPLQGVMLEMENGDHIGVLYGSICSAITFVPTLGVHFQFVDAGEIVK